MADAFVIAPPRHGPVAGPTETGTIFPFLIKQTDTCVNTNPIVNMRYQQVYNSSLFTNFTTLDPSLVYVTSLTLYFPDAGGSVAGWTAPKMQIDLSTTTNSADKLNSTFSKNVGQDDQVVFGPGSFAFPGSGPDNWVEFSRPFRYDPKLGNLLMDVRIFDGSGLADPV